eukprot:UN10611
MAIYYTPKRIQFFSKNQCNTWPETLKNVYTILLSYYWYNQKPLNDKTLLTGCVNGDGKHMMHHIEYTRFHRVNKYKTHNTNINNTSSSSSPSLDTSLDNQNTNNNKDIDDTHNNNDNNTSIITELRSE